MHDGFLTRAMRHPLFVAGFAIVGFISLAAILAPFITAHAPTAIDVDNVLKAPSLAHPLGTDARWGRLGP